MYSSCCYFAAVRATQVLILLCGIILAAGPGASEVWAETAPHHQTGIEGSPPPLSALSAVGSSFAELARLPEMGWNEAQQEAFIVGIRAALQGKPYSLDEAAHAVRLAMVKRIQENDRLRGSATSTDPAQAEQTRQYLKEMRKRLKMQETDSGMLYVFQATGRGVRPTPDDIVIVTLVGTDPAHKTPVAEISGERVRIKVGDLLPGLVEGVQMMTLGSRAVFVLPPELSFGRGEWPSGIERGSPLTFVVTLHEVISGMDVK